MRAQDPFLERESSRYEEPVPSRELILSVLNAQGVPVSDTALQKLLHVTASEQEGFQPCLVAQAARLCSPRAARPTTVLPSTVIGMTRRIERSNQCDFFRSCVRENAGRSRMAFRRQAWSP